VIKEGEYGRVVRDKSAEAYLADGVVQFHRRKRGDGSLIPMFRVVKMRGAEIDSRYYALQVSSGNLRFVPAVAT
jgi:KaiC/GvpD/RAD55 family RecA-like ATPase